MARGVTVPVRFSADELFQLDDLRRLLKELGSGVEKIDADSRSRVLRSLIRRRRAELIAVRNARATEAKGERPNYYPPTKARKKGVGK